MIVRGLLLAGLVRARSARERKGFESRVDGRSTRGTWILMLVTDLAMLPGSSFWSYVGCKEEADGTTCEEHHNDMERKSCKVSKNMATVT